MVETLKNTSALVKFPGASDRLYIVGRTGSGKTQAGLWHLSGHNFTEQAGLIVDTKGDKKIAQLCAEIPQIKTIDVNDTPDKPGLYRVRPLPTPDDAIRLDALFRRIWERENCLVYIDEGYAIEVTDAFNSILTQGRDKNIPVIVLSQRPAWITKFVESEADFVQVFNLNRFDDRKKIAGVVPPLANKEYLGTNYRLAPYCSYWYNVADDSLVEFGPVPDFPKIINTFRARFPPEQAQFAPEPGAPSRKVARYRVV
ncbi:MAG: hypothetical protein KGJ13_05435 [Patescibacteria group bacterium]|nr:hypothetical protein [Patescibacteria group bacterium]